MRNGGIRDHGVRNGAIRGHGVRNGGARNRNVHNPTRRPYRIRPRPRLHRPCPHRRGGRHQLRRPFRHDGGPRDRGGTPRGHPLCGRGGRDRGQPRHLRALRGTGPGIRGVDRPGDGLLRRPRRPAGHRRDGRLGHGRRGAHRVRAQQLAPHRRDPYGGRGLPGAAGPRPAHPLHRRAAGAPRRRPAHPGVALPRTAGTPHGDRGVHDGRRRHRTEPSDRPRGPHLYDGRGGPRPRLSGHTGTGGGRRAGTLRPDVPRGRGRPLGRSRTAGRRPGAGHLRRHRAPGGGSG